MNWKNSSLLGGVKLWQGAAVVLFLALAFAFFAFSSGHAEVQPAAASKAPSTLYFTDCLDSDDGNPYVPGTCTDSNGAHADLVDPQNPDLVTENYCGDDNLCHSTGWVNIAPVAPEDPQNIQYLTGSEAPTIPIDDSTIPPEYPFLDIDPKYRQGQYYCLCTHTKQEYEYGVLVGCTDEMNFFECRLGKTCYWEGVQGSPTYNCYVGFRYGWWWLNLTPGDD